MAIEKDIWRKIRDSVKKASGADDIRILNQALRGGADVERNAPDQKPGVVFPQTEEERRRLESAAMDRLRKVLAWSCLAELMDPSRELDIKILNRQIGKKEVSLNRLGVDKDFVEAAKFQGKNLARSFRSLAVQKLAQPIGGIGGVSEALTNGNPPDDLIAASLYKIVENTAIDLTVKK